MKKETFPTGRVLFVEEDIAAFQILECLVKVLQNIHPIELFHASDASDALSRFSKIHPHVIVMNNESYEDIELLKDNIINENASLVLFRNIDEQDNNKKQKSDTNIVFLPRSETLEEIHNNLIILSSLATKKTMEHHNNETTNH